MSDDEVVTAAPELIGVGAQAIVENAKRLGLTWTLRNATVNSTNPPTATYDGDTVSIGMTSLIGPPVAGSRVTAIFVPPSGDYIIGSAGTYPQRLSSTTYAIAPIAVSLPQAPATGNFITRVVSSTGLARWEVYGTADLRSSVVDPGVLVSILSVDGVVQVPLIVAQFAPTVTGRGTYSQNWSGTFTSVGDHTFSLDGNKTGAGGTAVSSASHTTLLIKVYE